MKSGWTDSKRKVRGCKERGDRIWILKVSDRKGKRRDT